MENDEERLYTDPIDRRLYILKRSGATPDKWQLDSIRSWNPSDPSGTITLPESQAGSLAWAKKMKLTWSSGAAFDEDLNLGHQYSDAFSAKEKDITDPNNTPASVEGVFRYAGRIEAQALRSPVHFPDAKKIENIANFGDTPTGRSPEFLSSRSKRIAFLCQKLEGKTHEEALDYIKTSDRDISSARERSYNKASLEAEKITGDTEKSEFWQKYFAGQIQTAKTNANYGVRQYVVNDFIKSMVPKFEPSLVGSATLMNPPIKMDDGINRHDADSKTTQAVNFFNYHVHPALIADMNKSPISVEWKNPDAATGGVEHGFNRSHYDAANHRVVIRPDADTFTVAHELGHHLATVSYGDMYARDFLRKRTLPETVPLARLTGDASYNTSEIAHPDRLINPYAGKEYGNSTTEIVSMGIENMMRDPVWFYEHDREHFLFTSYLIRGGLRR
jgi:hypothetical protein